MKNNIVVTKAPDSGFTSSVRYRSGAILAHKVKQAKTT